MKVRNKNNKTQIDFNSLERTHDDLYPQIASKPIPYLLRSRFGPNRFGIDLGLFAYVHMAAKPIGIGSKSI